MTGAMKHLMAGNITQTTNLIKGASIGEAIVRIKESQEGEETGPMVEKMYRWRYKETEERNQYT